ncbi:hypothetical protein E5288_WYG003702 [Bos mutus]|uniref:Uncharacterized protein n=1 Tax=Bos mutus TaxID=72004 RepID=A0A6B0S8G0_9CETA|nr:hypothetical protein [Bos mutus]
MLLSHSWAFCKQQGFNVRIECTYKNLLYSSTQNTAFLSNHDFHPQNFLVPLRPGTTMGTAMDRGSQVSLAEWMGRSPPEKGRGDNCKGKEKRKTLNVRKWVVPASIRTLMGVSSCLENAGVGRNTVAESSFSIGASTAAGDTPHR